jgi:hypothetical protein
VDHGAEKRYRDFDSFPGVEINEIGGRSFLKSMLEWNLPPIRFKNAGTRNVHAAWARPSLFTAVLVTDPDDGDLHRTYYDVGAQVDFKLRVQERLPMTVSFGYAVGFDDNGRSSDEFLVSLKIL